MRRAVMEGVLSRRGCGVALVVCALTLAAPVASQATVAQVFTGSPSPVSCTVQGSAQRFCSGSPSRVPSWDGTPIDVSVTLPPAPASGPDGRFPLVGIYHGYAGSKITPASGSTQRWVNRGYAVFSMSDRGFGASCGGPEASRPSGCSAGYVRLMDNRYEVRDAQYLMGLLADDGVIDPQRIGATGGSYGGGMSYALGALKDRVALSDGELVRWRSPGGIDMSIAATLPEYGWTDLAHSLMPNGSTLDYVANSPYRGPLGDRRVGVQKQNWSFMLYIGGLLGGGYYAPAGFDPSADLTGWNNAAASGGPYDSDPVAQQMATEITTNHSAYYIDDSRPPAPALLSSGWNDDLFPVDEAVRYYNKVRTRWPEAPMAMFHLDFGHGPRAASVGADTAQLTSAENAWFDHYVKGSGAEPADAHGGVDIITSRCATATGSARAAGARHHAADWGALAPGEVRIASDAAQAISARGDAAADSFTSGNVCATQPSEDDATAATYELDPAPAGGFTIAGSPTVIAETNVSGANDGVVARLYDVDPASSTERLIARGLLRPTGVGVGPTRQVFQLHPQAWTVAGGHVVKLELRAQDSPYARTAGAAAPQQPIVVSRLRLRLPVLDQPGAGGGVVQSPASKVVPRGYKIARDFDEPPALTASASPLEYAEGDATPVDAELVFTDPGTDVTRATIALSGGYQPSEDALAFADQNGIAGSWDPSTGTLTLTGTATDFDYEAALRSVTYRDRSDEPVTAPRTVTITVTNNAGQSVTATRDIAVSRVDDAPHALDDVLSVAQDSAATPIDVLSNDTDVDGGPLAVEAVAAPAHGTAALTAGRVTYRPVAGYCNTRSSDRPDTFQYALSGGSRATVSVTVRCSPLAPRLATAVRISHRDPRVTRRGALIGLRCAADVACKGTLVLRTTSRSSRLRSAAATTFTLNAGRARSYRVPVPKSARDRLARRGKAVARVVVRLADGRTVDRLITLHRGR